MIRYTKRISLLVKASDLVAFNSLLESEGFGRDNVSVPLVKSGVLSFYSCNWVVTSNQYESIKRVVMDNGLVVGFYESDNDRQVTKSFEKLLVDEKVERKGVVRA